MAPGCRPHPPERPANGAIAQLGERVVRNDEVGGSIPPGSTSLRSLRELRLGKPGKYICTQREKAAAPHTPPASPSPRAGGRKTPKEPEEGGGRGPPAPNPVGRRRASATRCLANR